MGMTIDLALDIFKHPTDYFPSEREEAWDYATEAMQKYQKIKEIIGNYGFDTSWLCLKKIREVVEDGNVD